MRFPRESFHLLSPRNNMFVEKSFCFFCRLYIDGPFGSPSEESLNYEVSLCVAGGIGVTPFASILNTLLYVNLTYLKPFSQSYFRLAYYKCFRYVCNSYSYLPVLPWREERRGGLRSVIESPNSIHELAVHAQWVLKVQCLKSTFGGTMVPKGLADQPSHPARREN